LAGVYKKIEIVGTSPVSWFEVAEQRGAIRDGKVTEFQVTLKVGFKVDG
jgi:flavin-binding protein dodecin